MSTARPLGLVDGGIVATGATGGLAGGSSQLGHGCDLPPRVMATPAFSEGTKGALAGGFEGGDGGGPFNVALSPSICTGARVTRRRDQ